MANASNLIISNPTSYVAPIALTFGDVGAMPSAVSADTPLPVAVQASASSMSLAERLNREGEPITVTARTVIPLAAMTAFSGAGPAYSTGVVNPAPGRAYYLASLSFFSTALLQGRFQIAATGSTWAGTGTYPAFDSSFACGPGSAMTLPVNAFIRSSDKTSGAGGFISQILDPNAANPVGSFTATTTSGSTTLTGVSAPVQVGYTVVGPGIPAGTTIASFSGTSAVLSAAATASASGVSFSLCGITLIVSASGWQMADPINFDAKKTILFLGDSLWNGTGPTDVTTCIPWLVNKFYREAGVDCRYILKSYSGSTSSGHDMYRKGGKYDFPRIDAIFFQLGTNDAVQGYATATSMANIQALIAWKQVRYPKARLVIAGPTPLQNATYEATLAALRAAIGSYVAALGDGSVQFCDLGNSFDRTVDANYVTSDGSGGTRVHPADAGLTQEWNGGYNGNIGLRAWLSANLPNI